MSGHILILDLHSGISGDMFVAAAAKLAGCEADVEALPAKLGLHGVKCRFSDVLRGGIACRKFDVLEGEVLAEQAAAVHAEPHTHGHGHEHGHHSHGEAEHGHSHAHAHEHGDVHDHAHTHEHGHTHVHGHEHAHGHSHAHSHEHTHEHSHPGHSHGEGHVHDHGHGHGEAHGHGAEASHHHHHHEHRALSDISAMIRAADLEPAVRERALRMFRRLGEVEAASHGIDIERVHFHEVGAIDSIVDIVAAALCIERLSPAKTYASPVCIGSGSVRTAHGMLPVPAPATERLLQGMPCVAGEVRGEWTTPTGALVLAELAPHFEDAALVSKTSAFGAGNKDTKVRPNAVRLRLAETHGPAAAGLVATGALLRDELVVLTTNIDDTTGELLGGDLLDLLLRAGARDAILQPITMKKGRPAVQLEVLTEAAKAEELAAVVLTQTSTIGVRVAKVSRLSLPREAVTRQTSLGPVAAKSVRLPGGGVRVTPEYEDCKRLASSAGVTVQEAYRAALAACVG